jgi:hypothetical protein
MNAKDKNAQDNQVPATSGNAGDNVPATVEKNPFERFADQLNSSTSIVGTLLVFNKGDWLVGRDKEDCTETQLVAVMPAMLDGWVRWEDNYPIEQIMGLVAQGFVPPARSTLSHTDRSTWELDSRGEPRDPWRKTIYLPVVGFESCEVYTFPTDSDGGRRRGIGPLCGEYGHHIRQYPGELPVVHLEQDSYQHPDRSIGRVKFPLLPVERWVPGDKYIAAVAAVAGRQTKQLENA